MRFKVGDKVRVNNLVGLWDWQKKGRENYVGKTVTIAESEVGVVESTVYRILEDDGYFWWTDVMLEPISDPLMAKVMERNNKPTKTSEHSSIQPEHYKNGDKDLFDEWHERYYNSEKTYTGREVFVEIMKSVAERYARRYPNKNEEDLEKAVYTLERLKEYEESEE